MATQVPPFQQLINQSHQQYAQGLATTQLQQPVGAAIEAALASVKDYAIDRLRQALKLKFELIAPPDALTQIGVERSLPQGLTESASAFATRLQDAWNSWPWAGTAFGLLRVLNATGYTNTILAQVVGGKVFSLDGSGNLVVSSEGNGIWETDPLSSLSPLRQSFWSKFDVVFPFPLIAAWSGGPPGSSSDESNFIRALIAAWKPAHSTCNRIVIVTAGRVLGYPIRTLGGGNGNIGSNTTVVWSP